MSNRKLALIIVNYEFEDERLQKLTSPAKDAEELAKILGDSQIGGFDHINLQVNQSDGVLRKEILAFFSKKLPDDMLFFYYSGHGVIDNKGRLYLATKQTNMDWLKATSIPSSFVIEEMDESRSNRQVLILDCCYSGSAIQGFKSGIGTKINTEIFEGNGYGRVVLSATDTLQLAWEGDRILGEVSASLFTHYFVEGIKTGEASPYKEWISIDDVYDYIYRKTIKSQTPLKTSVRQEGELVIARNPNPRIKKYDRIIDIPTGKQEFYGNSSIFGIDFGTTKSAVSIIHEGTPIIIRNERGEKFTPSVVAYLENDDVAVGTPAIIQAFADPDRAFFGVKRHIDERHPGWAISYGSPDSYVDIASKIFADLRNNAKKYSTDDKFQAVLCVPAYFTEKQKKAVYLAAKQGGFDVLRMIPEPVAAALAYGVEKDELIIVCDLGGGTFDVSIMEIGDGVAQVHVVNGDNLLGGIDFDKRIAEFLTDDFSKKHGVNLSNDKIAQMRLMEAAEQAKIALSELETTTIFVHNIYMDKLGGKSINVSLSREHFDKLTEDLVARVETCCQAAVKDSDWDYYDNHPEYYKKKIVFVGLSTQIPAVRKKIQEIFRAPVDFSVDPNDVVVIGASIHAGVLSGTVRDTMLLNVASMSLGVETSGSVMRCLVKRNTTIPTRKTEVFTTTEDNQTSACIHILQGERPMASDNKSLGGFYLEDIPPTYRGIPQIEVTFDIDANGVIKVSAEEKTVGKEKKLIISTYGELHNDSPFQMMDGTAITSTRN